MCIFKTGTIATSGDSLWVKGRVQDTPCNCIIDTGSNITIVRPDILERVQKEIKIKRVDCFKQKR
jgi:hypothetical protein